VAQEAWNAFLKRNQSVIVDHLYGQYKSIVDCPKCEY
jgi:ubiquitin carboxyl-terminal hydrolase 4/11